MDDQNVRRMKAGGSIQNLSEDIARRGLLTSLNVRPRMSFPCYDGPAKLKFDVWNMAEAERYFAPAKGVCAQQGSPPEALGVLPF
ncbi:hypothetical protein HJC06_13765 [Rhizobium sp. NLR9b]|uniref:hypothetical protein n=1 Tax=unclassified Rhizobium TaxID=2613769 RepID=UPI001C830D98|nr:MULTISPECIES: hypothetical protein [unclassified Rhizobium]MBX5227484.1 hypothetical protein [Rhizobium sp. NLR9b]MBX5288528.1 hypothetical protein [Rhizobium sp. NLR10b]